MENEDRAAVVYYSKDSRMRLGAAFMQRRVNGKIVELRGSEGRGRRLQGMPWEEIAQSRQVYLLLVLSANEGVQAAKAFLRNAEFRGKDVFVITFGDRAHPRRSERLNRYISDVVAVKNGLVRGFYAFAGDDAGEETLRRQIETVRLTN